MTDHTEAIGRELVTLVRGAKDLHHALQPRGTEPLIEPPAFAVLARLQERGPIRLSSLAGCLYVDLSTISRQVKELEQHGWVLRERDPDDARAYLLGLTPAGVRVLEAGRSQRGATLRRMLTSWTDDERQSLATELARFNQAVAAFRQENVS
jgi:DNA-binding MarR family transcriptional regulator